MRLLDPQTVALSVNALRLHLVADAIRQRATEDRVTKAEAAKALAEALAKEAFARAARASWWAQYGFWVGVGVTLVTVGAIAGAVAWALR